MGKLLRTLFTLCFTLLLATPLIRAIDENDPAMAAADSVEEEEDVMTADDDVMVEDEEEEKRETVQVPPGGGGVTESDEAGVDEEEEEDEGLKVSPDVHTTVLFTDYMDSMRFPAGEVVHSLIGLNNKGQQDYIATQLEASLRYPQDYNYHIQNFTSQYYNQYIEPNTSASFLYSFMPSETFSSRTFGLTINVYYKDQEGNEFVDAVYNDTVNVVEIDEGFDHHSFFMYVFMITGISLLMYVMHYVYTTVRRPGKYGSKRPVETGTQGNKSDVDYDWLPPGTVSTPKKSPHRSPRGRKPKTTDS